eukprot:1141594-Pleurochrysis_carterae.AAC.2
MPIVRRISCGMPNYCDSNLKPSPPSAPPFRPNAPPFRTLRVARCRRARARSVRASYERSGRSAIRTEGCTKTFDSPKAGRPQLS